DAALELTARWGIGKTSVADLAQAAGCSRATLYRVFPGGKAEVFNALGRRELHRYFGQITAAIAAAPDATEALTAGIVAAAGGLRDHEAVQFLLRFEPDVLLPYLGFKRVDALLRAAAAACAPFVVAHVDPGLASWTGELIGRLVLSFTFMPHDDLDLADPVAARHLVTTFIIPALVAGSPSHPTSPSGTETAPALVAGSPSQPISPSTSTALPPSAELAPATTRS
ncbi:MAG TPA: TetR/AcrR family transcriptional regulator, partial [Acidimicrobiales bacterium]